MLRRFLSLWSRVTVQPQEIGERIRSQTAPVCYVLERQSSADLALLKNVCATERLPRPTRRLLSAYLGGRRAAFALERTVGLWRRRVDRRIPEQLIQMVQALRQDPELDVGLVPVAVYWGRAPQKERSILRLALAENWTIGSRLRDWFRVLINGRNTMVQMGGPVSLRALAGESGDATVAARRVLRALRTQLAHARAARIGPDLSHRHTIVAEVLRTRAVRAAIAAQLRDTTSRKTRRELLLEARRYADEIAANYSHAFVSFMSRLLAWLWTRLYGGVEVAHVETLQSVSEGNEVIYVPCHRSHMDYLLLGYAIYQHGYAVPHTAAGVNLNLPVVGRFLRKGGGFFIRRSFRGSSLYTVVFMKYLAAIMARGHSIEYFIEGGRSRTGRLLVPKTGMLSMTVRSYIREPRRPVVFVPVYFGYERIVEGSSYLAELSGKPKEKESIPVLIRSVLRNMRENYGRVHVNLGEPIRLNTLLDRYAPDWRSSSLGEQDRPRWVGEVVDDLAGQIMRNINSAAAVTPVNLLALALLATPRQTMLTADLMRQLEVLLKVLRTVSYGPRVTITRLNPAEIIDYGIALKMLTRENQRAGDFVRMSPEAAVLATYYRNNVLHLMAMPSLIACGFLSNPVMRVEDLQRLAFRIYPYIAAELFLQWSEAELPQVVEQTLAALSELGLLQGDAGGQLWQRPEPTSAAAIQLSFLAQSTVQTIERYYLAIALLIQAGSGEITQKTLEERCQLMAQRMTLLYGLNSPEFFDRPLFESFIDLLRARGVLAADEQGRLRFDEVLMRVAADAQVVLSEQIRHSILQVTHG
jgi:glycerol-3-phosphate O-acyltransferase